MRASFLPCCALAVLAAFSSVPGAYANHGPGASGAGTNTISGETLPPGKISLSLREDYSQFEHFDRPAAEARAVSGGAFDALDHGFLTTVEAACGITDYLQIGASLGLFHGQGFLSADQGTDEVEFGTGNPTGLTDLALSAKVRLLKGQPGNLSLVLGLVIPTGRTDYVLDNGERPSPTDQPGTGRFGLPVGLAWSRFLTPRLTLDASVLYTHRFEKDLYKIGDRLDAGLTLAWRITESINAFPQYSVFGELYGVCLLRDRDHGAYDPNSGSSTLYATPGMRVRFDPRTSLSVAPSFPLYQHVNGNQGDVHFKLAVVLSYTF